MRLVRLSSVALAVGLCLLTASGCGSKPGSIEVNPKELRFNSVGEAAPLLVRLLDVEGKAMEHKPFTFISQDGHVADVRQDGTVVSVDSGATDIHVSYAGLTTKVPVRVALPAKVKLSAKCVKRCSVVRASPLSLRLEGIGAEARLISEVLDNEGQKLPLEVEFHAADPDFQAGHRKLGIEVARDGEVTSLGVGKFMVTAGVGSASDQMAIEVFFPVVDKVVAQKTMFLKPDETKQVSARGFRRNDRADEWLEAARLSFSSADAAVARVDDEGRITAVAVGETDVISSADGGAQGSAFDMTHVVVALEAPKVIALPKVAAKVAQKVKAAAPKKAGKK